MVLQASTQAFVSDITDASRDESIASDKTAASRRMQVESLVRQVAQQESEPTKSSFVASTRGDSRAAGLRDEYRQNESQEWRSNETTHSAAQGVAPPIAQTMTVTAPQAVAQAPQAHLQLMEQVAQESKRQIRLGKREFKIQLSPESLGNIELEVSVDDDGMTVRFNAASPEAQRLLEEHMGELEDVLSKQGMAVDRAQSGDATPRRNALRMPTNSLARNSLELREWASQWTQGRSRISA
jgi:flagellar hook-length control protein FliK